MGTLDNMGFTVTGILLAVVLWNSSVVHCQAEDKPRIYSLHIRSDILFRFATTLVTSRLANPVNESRAAVFRVTLPQEAFISNFTLEIDGIVYPGDVKGKKQAKKQYEAAKKKGQSAGHVSQSPRDTRNFKVEVNVAALSKVTFNLTYQELLQRKRGIYQHKIYVNPGQPVDDLSIKVAIQESRKITTLRVPPISTDIITNEYKDENTIAVITRRDPKSALVTFVPTLEQQTEKSTSGLAGQFIVEYDVDRTLDAGDLLVVNGYFVHFIAPDIQSDIPKDVIFVLDKSGSMSGRKLQQLQEAMYEILSDLQPEDRFTVVSFSIDARFLYETFMPATPENILDAKRKIKNIRASGGTDINDALLNAIKKFVDQQDGDYEERAPVILFLTDGRVAYGDNTYNETYNEIILANAQAANTKTELNIALNSLAFGDDADYGFVQKLALQNNGVARKIYEDSDAALQITGFYSEVSNTMLRNVSVQYLSDTVDKDSLTKANLGTFFGGSELIVAGRLADDATALDLNVFGNGADGDLVLALDPNDNVVDFSKVSGLIGEEDFAKITEKMWAYLTIKEYLEKIDSGDLLPEVVEELKEKALNLSLKLERKRQYSFVTRMTSMVVTKPEEKPNAEELAEGSDIARDTGPTIAKSHQSSPAGTGNLPSRYSSGGGGGGGGGGYGGGGGGDPHYMVRLYGLDHPLCFDFNSEREEFYQLINDPVNDVMINVATVLSERHQKNGDPMTFIGKIGLKINHHIVVITPDAIIFDKTVLTWDESDTHHFGKHSFSVIEKKDTVATLSLRFNFGATVYIQRHLIQKQGLPNYLNVYVSGEDSFSKKTVGLIGQFVNGQKQVIMKKQFASASDQAMAKFQVKEGPVFHVTAGGKKGKKTQHVVRARLLRRQEIVYKASEMCWMVYKRFLDLLIGTHDDFVVPILLPVLETVDIKSPSG